MTWISAAPAVVEPPQTLPESRLLRAHRFLADNAFYPLLLCAALGVAFWIVRALMLGHLGYSMLIKNLFLAWVPYGLSLYALVLATRAQAARRWLVAVVWAAWLAMLPNAPYIFTDLIHWRHRREMVWWFDLGLVLTFALAGCFAGIVSLRIMHDLVRARVGSVAGWLFVMIVTMLVGLGIDLGRFERWNSWDLLTRPHHIFAQLASGLANPRAHDRTIGVTLMFGALVLVTYVMFTAGFNARRDEPRDAS